MSRWTSFKVWDRTVLANPHDTVANDLGTDGLFCQTRPRTCRHDGRRLNSHVKASIHLLNESLAMLHLTTQSGTCQTAFRL